MSDAARAFTINEFNRIFLDIQCLNPGCAAYLVDIGTAFSMLFLPASTSVFGIVL